MSDDQSRRHILDALRAARRPFPNVEPPVDHLPVIPRLTSEAGKLVEQFVEQATTQGAQVQCVADDEEALQALITILQPHKRISSWTPEAIGLPGLSQALSDAGITISDPRDPAPEVGLTGALAGLAATGSLVLKSEPGAFRTTSLLPPVHVAILRHAQLLPDLESWFAAQRHDHFETMRRASNIVIVTGPSRTADIAMELVMGMHGPRALHIILISTH